jgi:hypothetical protein
MDEVDWPAWFLRLLCRAWALGQGGSDRVLNSPCSSCERIDLRILRRKQDIGASTEAVGCESETSDGCRMAVGWLPTNPVLPVRGQPSDRQTGSGLASAQSSMQHSRMCRPADAISRRRPFGHNATVKE